MVKSRTSHFKMENPCNPRGCRVTRVSDNLINNDREEE